MSTWIYRSNRPPILNFFPMNWRNSCGDDAFVTAGLADFVSDIGSSTAVGSFTGIPNHRERLAAFAAAVPRRVPAAVPGRVPDHLAATTTFAASRTYPGIVSAIGPSFRVIEDQDLLTNVDNDATHSSKRSPSSPPRGSPLPPFPHLRVRGSPPPPSKDTCHGCIVGFAIVVAAGVAAGAIIAGVYFASRELSALLRSL